MENEEKIYHLFFGKNFKRSTIWLFSKWMSAQNEEENKKRLKQLFDKSPSVATQETWEDLSEIKKSLRLNHSALNVPHLFTSRWKLAAAICLLLLLPTSISYWYFSLYPTVEYQTAQMQEVFVADATIKHFNLPDGTKVSVDAGSLIVYPSVFSSKERTVYLYGRAHFEVVKNKHKPFIVRTNHLNVRALGTIFDVQAYSNESQTSTLLEEGSIEVSFNHSEKKPVILSPSNKLVFDHKQKNYFLKRVDEDEMQLWTKGYLFFTESHLIEIISAIERRYAIEVHYDQSAFAQGAYNIKFKPHAKLQEVLTILQQLIGFKYQIQGNQVFIKK